METRRLSRLLDIVQVLLTNDYYDDVVERRNVSKCNYYASALVLSSLLAFGSCCNDMFEFIAGHILEPGKLDNDDLPIEVSESYFSVICALANKFLTEKAGVLAGANELRQVARMLDAFKGILPHVRLPIVELLFHKYLEYFQEEEVDPLDSVCELLISFPVDVNTDSARLLFLKLARLLQKRIQQRVTYVQSYLGSLASRQGLELVSRCLQIDMVSPTISSNLYTPTGDYTLGFWLRVGRQANIKTSTEEGSEGVQRYHLLSRVPETGEFNYLALFAHKFPCACNPSVFLVSDDGEHFYLSVYVTLPPQGKATAALKHSRRIHMKSKPLVRDRWTRVSISLSVERSINNSGVKVAEELTKVILYFDGKLEQEAEASSSFSRTSLHQTLVIGAVPTSFSSDINVTQGPPDERSISMSDVYWLPACSQPSITPEMDMNRIPPSVVLDEIDILRSLLLSTLNKIEFIQKRFSDEELLDIALLSCQVMLTGSGVLQEKAVCLIRACLSHSSLAATLEKLVKYILLAVSGVFDASEWEGMASLRPTDCEDAERIWYRRCSYLNLPIYQLRSQNPFTCVRSFNLDENRLLKLIASVISDAAHFHVLDSSALLELVNTGALSTEVLDIFLDVSRGGWHSVHDRLLLPSRGLNTYAVQKVSTRSEADPESNLRSVDEVSAFASRASIAFTGETKGGIWISSCVGFFQGVQDEGVDTNDFVLPAPKHITTTSETITSIDFYQPLTLVGVDQTAKKSSTPLLSSSNFCGVLQALVSGKAERLDALKVFHCLTKLRSILVQMMNSLDSALDLIVADLSSIVSLALLDPIDLAVIVYEGGHLKATQLEVLKSLLKESDVSFLEKISLRQWKCFHR